LHNSAFGATILIKHIFLQAYLKASKYSNILRKSMLKITKHNSRRFSEESLLHQGGTEYGT